MNDHQHSENIEAPASALFDYLADVRNLPSYFSAMTSATPADGDAVRVVAEVEGTTKESEAWFRVDTERMHLSWGSEGDNDYHGELDVTGDETASAVTITLHTEHAIGARIDEGILASLASVKSLVEAGVVPTA